MATECSPQAPSDYFSQPKREASYNFSSPSFAWDQSPYSSEPALSSSHSSRSNKSSVGTLGSALPDTTPYSLGPASALIDSKAALELSSLSPNNNFDDWMRWDETESNALSPLQLIEPFSSALKVEARTPKMASIPPAPRTNGLDDTSMDFEDSLNDEPLFRTSFPEDIDSQDGPSAEGLYSTPLSWSEPAPGRRTSKVTGSPSNTFNPKSIEPSTLYPIDLSQIHPTESTHFASPSSSPEPGRQRKHKHSSISDDDEEESSTSPPPPSRRHAPKKTAHNMIEKRYRTNLNDKITALRDSVPSLRLAAEAAGKTKSSSRHHSHSQSPLTPNGHNELEGLPSNSRNEPHPKLNKATVLSKATEYIAHLEKRSNHLSRENAHLKARIDAFETLLMGQGVRGGQGAQRPIYEVGRKPERVLPPLQSGRW